MSDSVEFGAGIDKLFLAAFLGIEMRLRMNNIYLRPISLDDTDYIIGWRNSPNIIQRLFNQEKLTKAMHLKFYKENIETGKYMQFMVERIDESNVCSYPIGTAFFKNIDLWNQKCEYGIFTKDMNLWKEEFGYLPTLLMLKKAFEEMNMNKVYLYVYSTSEEEISVFQKCGFKIEGKLSQEIKSHNKYRDVYYMAILKEAFEENQRRDTY